jgi:hypothetical protein
MSSMTRSIRRGIIFANTNKQQRTYYRSSTTERRKEFERELGEKLRKKEVEKLDRA